MIINNLKILSILGILEGISFLMLLGVCMPLKYVFDIPEPTSAVGMAHGLLFIAYCAWVIIVSTKYKWPTTETLWALLASVLPFGTFVAEKRIFQQYA
jgi:integral membrane protein